MKLFISLVFFLLAPHAFAQKTDRKLQRQIENAILGYNGDIGIYIKDLKKNKVVVINADTVFPTASIIKIPIMIGVMDKIRKKELSYNQTIVYKDSLLYAGVDILGSFKQDEKIELGKVMMLMLTMSDNTASLWLQSLAGTGTRVNQIMDSAGFPVTKVNSRTPGREGNRTQYGWGQTTPREMATVMERIATGKMWDEATSAKMLRLLSRNFWDTNAISQIPADVFIASKNGAVNESRSEVLYVNGKKARYIFSIFTKNNKDQSWQADNEAWVLTRRISALLWSYFN